MMMMMRLVRSAVVVACVTVALVPETTVRSPVPVARNHAFPRKPAPPSVGERALNKELARARSAQDVLRLWDDRGQEFFFNEVNVATAVHRCGRCQDCSSADERFGSLVDAATAGIARERWASRSVAMTVWGVARVGLAAPQLFEAVARHSRGIQTWSSQSLSNTAWSFAKSATPPGAFFDFVAGEFIERLRADDFDPQHVSNLAWAFAKARHNHADLFAAIQVALTAKEGGRIGDFKPQELANLVWACAKLQVDVDGAFLKSVAAACVKQVDAFNAQALANTAWAFASLGAFDEALFAAVAASASRRRLAAFNSQALANTAWAFATVGFADGAFFDAAAARALEGLRGEGVYFRETQEAVNFAWALSKVRGVDPEIIQHHTTLFEALALDIAGRADELTGQALATSSWAFSRGDARDYPALFKAIANRVPARIDDIEAGALAKMAWACARAGHPVSAAALVHASAHQASKIILRHHTTSASSSSSSSSSDHHFDAQCVLAELGFPKVSQDLHHAKENSDLETELRAIVDNRRKRAETSKNNNNTSTSTSSSSNNNNNNALPAGGLHPTAYPAGHH